MRKFLWIALGITILLYVTRPQPESEAPASGAATAAASVAAAAPDEVPRDTVRLRVLTSMGVETTLAIDENTEVLVVASWCPVTRALNGALGDLKAKPYTRGKRLIYLLAWNELDRYAARWVNDGRWTQEQVDAFIASQPRGPRLYDRDFLRSIAAQRVYYFDDAHPLRFTGYPAAFSAAPNEFLLNYGVWMRQRLGMPKALRDELLDAYEAGE